MFGSATYQKISSHPSILPSIYPCMHPCIHSSTSMHLPIHASTSIHRCMHSSIHPPVHPQDAMSNMLLLALRRSPVYGWDSGARPKCNGGIQRHDQNLSLKYWQMFPGHQRGTTHTARWHLSDKKEAQSKNRAVSLLTEVQPSPPVASPATSIRSIP